MKGEMMNAIEQENDNWVEKIGKPSYACIVEMVAALQCDRERLEELRDERQNLVETRDDLGDDTGPGKRSAEYREAARAVKEWDEENGEELADLIAEVTLDGEEVDEDEARERISEDPLSLRIFGELVNGEWEANKYELLLSTGGPAVRIVGDLDRCEPCSARLEVQDWFKPWTEYLPASQDTLLAYVGCFCFE